MIKNMFSSLGMIGDVAPDIAAAHKIILDLWKKNRYLASCSFRGKDLV
jgi:hypothetical protein